MIIIQGTSYILPGKRCALAKVGKSRPIPRLPWLSETIGKLWLPGERDMIIHSVYSV